MRLLKVKDPVEFVLVPTCTPAFLAGELHRVVVQLPIESLTRILTEVLSPDLKGKSPS